MTMRTPRRSAISQSMHAEFSRLGQIFGLCGGPCTHTIQPHSHDHRIKGNPSSHKKWSLLRSRKHSRVSGHDTRHKWMRCWRHGLRLCPVLAKWSHCGASYYPCPESLMITQCQTKISHIRSMSYCLLIADHVIKLMVFFFLVWLRLFKFTRCPMLRTLYKSIILFVNYVCFITRSCYEKCCAVTRSWESCWQLILGNI
jgi:hypothetical protein